MARDPLGFIIATDQIQRVDLESLYGVQVRLQFEFWKIDDLIPSVKGGMADDNERVDVTLWQEPKRNFSPIVSIFGLLQPLPG